MFVDELTPSSEDLYEWIECWIAGCTLDDMPNVEYVVGQFECEPDNLVLAVEYYNAIQCKDTRDRIIMQNLVRVIGKLRRDYVQLYKDMKEPDEDEY